MQAGGFQQRYAAPAETGLIPSSLTLSAAPPGARARAARSLGARRRAKGEAGSSRPRAERRACAPKGDKLSMTSRGGLTAGRG